MTARTVFVTLRLINRILWPLILPIVGCYWLFSRKDRPHFLERLGLSGSSIHEPSKRTILFHLASLGEAHAAMPLIESLQQKYSLMLTTTSLTGRDALKRRFPQVSVSLAPIDLPDLWGPFLKSRKIAGILLFETEIWPSMLASALSLDVKVGVVNGRLSTKGFDRIRRFGILFSPLVKEFSPVLVQTALDAERFQKLGVRPEKIQVTGNIKWDIPDPCGNDKSDKNLEKWLESPEKLRDGHLQDRGVCRILLSSFHPDETREVLTALEGWSLPAVLLHLVIAPRHLDKMESYRKFLPPGVTFRSEKRKDLLQDSVNNQNVVTSFLDSYGELRQLTCLCDIAVIGGTLERIGGHSPIDAAAAGIPILCGPYIDHIRELVEELEKGKALIRVQGAGGIRKELEALIANTIERKERGRNARKVFDSMKGSRQKTLNALEGFFLEPAHRIDPESP